MLLGYISEVVKSGAEAEKYLVDIFNQLQFVDMQRITAPGKNTFVQLQGIARQKLASFVSSVDNCDAVVSGNKFVDMMSADQKLVFCGLHYHGKTTIKMAAELNKTEPEVKQLLKEAFKIIRAINNDTATIHR